MMERVVRLCAVAATTFLFSAAILVSAANFDFAQAQSRAASRACGKELMKQCSGVPVGVPFGVPVKPTNALQCLQKNHENLSARCAALANKVVRGCDRDAARLCQG